MSADLYSLILERIFPHFVVRLNKIVHYSLLIVIAIFILGGKLIFAGPGPLELHAHYIMVSDGGELRIGSLRNPFCGSAHIHLHGSSHSPVFFPYGVKFLAVRNGSLSMHGKFKHILFCLMN